MTLSSDQIVGRTPTHMPWFTKDQCRDNLSFETRRAGVLISYARRIHDRSNHDALCYGMYVAR